MQIKFNHGLSANQPSNNCALVKSICERGPKSLFWAPAVWQDWSTYHDWSVKKA